MAIEAAVPGAGVKIILNPAPSAQHSLQLDPRTAIDVVRFLRDDSELALDFLMVDPEYVSGHDVDATGFHLEEFLAPLILGNTRKVKFAHDGYPRLAVEQQTAAVRELLVICRKTGRGALQIDDKWSDLRRRILREGWMRQH